MPEMRADTRIIDWAGCYDGNWRGVITDEAFAHPAKFARGLVERILDHGLAEGWWKPGDLIGDPFGGIGTGGICAAYKKLRWIGVELEPRFVAMAEANFRLHARTWAHFNQGYVTHPAPKIVHGDSRKFAEIVAAAGIVTSPPYAGGMGHGGAKNNDVGRGDRRYIDSVQDQYGSTPGQIGELPAGNIDAVVTSPMFGECRDDGSGIAKDGEACGRAIGRSSLAGVVTSPPYAANEKSDYLVSADGKTRQRDEKRGFKQGHGCFRGSETYGESEGQIGREREETYWQAMDQVYRQCFAALKPGGYMAVVIKDYVKNKQRVPLCDQSMQLLEHIGFEPVQRIRAWLVKETREPTLCGNEIVTTKERKSFFRRLAEKKGSPRIDFEEVLVVRKPSFTTTPADREAGENIHTH
jgi:DNA modification methylase